MSDTTRFILLGLLAVIAIIWVTYTVVGAVSCEGLYLKKWNGTYVCVDPEAVR